jgi:hypothetical protein
MNRRWSYGAETWRATVINDATAEAASNRKKSSMPMDAGLASAAPT